MKLAIAWAVAFGLTTLRGWRENANAVIAGSIMSDTSWRFGQAKPRAKLSWSEMLRRHGTSPGETCYILPGIKTPEAISISLTARACQGARMKKRLPRKSPKDRTSAASQVQETVITFLFHVRKHMECSESGPE